jgi:hypothetical protein
VASRNSHYCIAPDAAADDMFEELEKSGCVAIGGAEMGDISAIRTREGLTRGHLLVELSGIEPLTS